MAVRRSRWLVMYVDFWSEGMADRLLRNESGFGEPDACADGGTARSVLVLAEAPKPDPSAAPAAEESMPNTLLPAPAPAWTAGAAEVRAAGIANRDNRSEA